MHHRLPKWRRRARCMCGCRMVLLIDTAIEGSLEAKPPIGPAAVATPVRERRQVNVDRLPLSRQCVSGQVNRENTA